MLDSAESEPLRIGIDACCWIHPRGYGRYTRELITAMVAAAPNDRFVLFADAVANVGIDLDSPNVERIVVDQSVPPTRAAATSNSRSLADIFRLYRAVSRERPDVFLIPSVYLSIPVPRRVPSVVIVHDAIAERFPELTLPGRRDRLFWRAKVALALRQARRVLTVSEFSALELERYLGIERSRMRVTLEAPAPVYRPSSPEEIATAAARHGMGPKDRWLIYVGGVNPHKNLTSLVEALSGVREALGEDAPYLFLVGPGGRDGFHDEVAEVRRAIAGANLSHAVKWPGFVDDEELRHLYSGATALVLPSLAEGFGLPAVEAAACGTPVVATTQSPLPQLLEGGGFFVDPHDVGAITESLLALLNDPSLRMRMGACAARRAGELSWMHAATVALETCREAAATKRPQPHGGSVYAGARYQ